MAADPDPAELLRRHLPVLRYDRSEPYAAVSVDAWVSAPGTELRRGDGTVLARSPGEGPGTTPDASSGAGDALRRSPGRSSGANDGSPRAPETPPGAGEAPALAVGLLGPHHYADGHRTPAERDDRITGPSRNPVRHARRIRADPDARDHLYGHAARGTDGRMWLAYWSFYPYNDYEVVGRLLRAGLHEGDWETVQLRLGEDGAPDLAVYARHKGAAHRAWADVERLGERPVVYVARGSHAAYFDAGTHWTGTWFDRANGRGRLEGTPTLDVVTDGDPAFHWVAWPGTWGGTRPRTGILRRIDATSPRGPGQRHHWRDPALLLRVSREDG